MSFQRFLQDWVAPTFIGLAVATLLLAFSRWFDFSASKPINAQWQGPVSYAQAVSRSGPAVVNIYTRVPRQRHQLLNDPFFQRLFNAMNVPQRERMQSNLGSGVIVDDQGYILTNHHVVAAAESIAVQLADGREVQARVVGSDPDFDLAVLKIDLSPLTAIEVGEAEKAQVGDVVLAIGNPFGVGQTVTQGIVSAIGRSLGNPKSENYLQNFIQTDAAVNPGNSGGALVDAQGFLLGINTSILNQSGSTGGISFAIPANIALKIMQDIIEFGRVVPGWLGIEGQTLSAQFARSHNLNVTSGVILTGIYSDGPAHLAGLQPRDIITHINSVPINDGDRGEATMASLRPGTLVSVTFIRNGEEKTVQATISEKPQEKNLQLKTH